jgi:hypothetical protein
MRLLYTIITLLLLSSCGPRYGEFFPCHDDGTVKPRVVLLPTSDITGRCELSQEIMEGIRYTLMDRGDLYVYPEETVNRQIAKLGNTPFFGLDVSYARQFGGADYVVATELAECRSDLYGNVEDKCMPPHLQRKNLLIVKLRVRVIDLRCNSEPTIVLQEIMTRQMLIPNRQMNGSDVDSACYSEICSRLVNDFVQRLEDTAWRFR